MTYYKIKDLLEKIQKNYNIDIPKNIVFFDTEENLEKLNEFNQKLKDDYNNFLEKEERNHEKTIESYNNALNLSHERANSDIKLEREKTDKVITRLERNLCDFSNSIKFLNKKEDELRDEKIDKSYNEYLLSLKKFNKDKLDIKENYNNAINYLVDTLKDKKEKIISAHNEEMENLRKQYEEYQKRKEKADLLFVDEISEKKMELKKEDEDYQIFYISQMNLLNIKIKEKQDEIKKIKDLRTNKLNQKLLNVRDSKKELLEKLETEKDEMSLKDYQKKYLNVEDSEKSLLLKLANAKSIYDNYLKSELLFLQSMQDVTSLVKRYQENDIQISLSINDAIFKLKKDNVKLGDEKNLIKTDIKLKKERESFEHSMKEENTNYQKQTQYQMQIMENNIKRADINIEIARLNFILEKLKSSNFTDNNKNQNNINYSKSNDEFEYQKENQKMLLAQKISAINQRTVRAQNKGNLIVIKSFHNKKESLFKKVNEQFLLEINMHFDVFLSWKEKVLSLLLLVPTLYSNLPFMNENYYNYLEYLVSELLDLYNRLDWLSNLLASNLSNYFIFLKEKIEINHKEFLKSITDYLIRIENNIEYSSIRINNEIRKNYTEINKQKITIDKEKKKLKHYKKQLSKLARIKDKKANVTKINYRFGYEKTKLSNSFGKIIFSEIKKKNKSLEKTLIKNNDITNFLNEKKKKARKIVEKEKEILINFLYNNLEDMKEELSLFSSNVKKDINLVCDILRDLKNNQQYPKQTKKLQQSLDDIIRSNRNVFNDLRKKISDVIKITSSKYLSFLRMFFKKEHELTKASDNMQDELFKNKEKEDEKLRKSYEARSKKYQNLLRQNAMSMDKTTRESQKLEEIEIMDKIKESNKDLLKAKNEYAEKRVISEKNIEDLFEYNNSCYKNSISKITNMELDKIRELDKKIKDNITKLRNQDTVFNNMVNKNYHDFLKEKDKIGIKLKREQNKNFQSLYDIISKIS